MYRKAVVLVLIVGCWFAGPGVRRAACMDHKERRSLEAKVRDLRGLKTAEGKKAEYAEILEALQDILAKHEGDPEALRVIRARFFWDVARHRRREISQDQMKAARDAYASLTGELDEAGTVQHRIEAHRMLGEFDQESYLAEADTVTKAALSVKETEPEIAVDFLNDHMSRLWHWKKAPEALAAFTRLANEFPEDGDAGWKLYEKASWFLKDHRDRGPLQNILAVIDPHRERIIAAIDRERNEGRRRQRLGELLERYAKALLKADRGDDALSLAERFEVSAPEDPSAPLLKARCLLATGNTGDAVQSARKTILLSPASSTAFTAQSFIADAMLESGDTEAALSEARILFDVAVSEKELGAAIQTIGKVLSARDGHLANANAFVLFQESGADAEGAHPVAVPRRVDPAFAEQAIKTANAIETGVSPSAHRRKAILQMYAGKPDDALATLTRAYRLLDTDGKSVEATVRCMAAACRAKAGEALAAEPLLSYQEFGPAGPDGAPGNQDDLASPYPEISPLGADSVKIAEAKALEIIRNAPASDAAVNGLIEYGSVLSLAGQSDEALSVARAAYSIANDEKTLNRAVMAVASALRAQRGHIAVANEYIECQRYGTAGKDEQPGTPDDLQDPLAGIPLQLPESFSAALKEAATEKEASGDLREAGYLRLMLGDAKGAVTVFKKCRAGMDFNDKAVARHMADVLAALKALNGHTFGGNAYIEFQRFGPAGRDGVAGTDDDLADPLAGY